MSKKLEIISFDFDDTLSERLVQRMAKMFIDIGHEVYITTSRCKGQNRDLFKIAKKLGIPETRINFTEGAYKSEMLRIIGADWHFDDMEDERDKINEETDCLGLYPPMDVLEMLFGKATPQLNKKSI